jgi:uncharacterized membrane protein YgaE (UPF0421/DUF939 family)
MPPSRTTPFRRLRLRLRPHLWPIAQTAGAAVLAWSLARLLVDDPVPAFAAIAAVISVGATYGQRPLRAVELTAGVVLGLSVAALLVELIGTGPLQIGLIVILAMVAAVALGGGRQLLISEAAVSGILVASLAPTSPSLFPDRPLEALLGGVVALVVSAVAFPPDPRVHLARAANALLVELSVVLDGLAGALEQRDAARAAAALQAARDLDPAVRALEEALAVARETSRFAPARRPARTAVERYAAVAPHVDHAVRNARVLARHVSRYVRTGRVTPGELPGAVRALREAVWELGAMVDEPARLQAVREATARATAAAAAAYERERDLGTAELVVQVRSTAVDLLHAAQTATGGDAEREAPATEQLTALAPR